MKKIIALLSLVVVACGGSEEGEFTQETPTVTGPNTATATDTTVGTVSTATATVTDSTSTTTTATTDTATTTVETTTTTGNLLPSPCTTDLDCNILSKCITDSTGRSSCINQCKNMAGFGLTPDDFCSGNPITLQCSLSVTELKNIANSKFSPISISEGGSVSVRGCSTIGYPIDFLCCW